MESEASSMAAGEKSPAKDITSYKYYTPDPEK
jgi:hypothetical protein